jgi:hypothetical protein
MINLIKIFDKNKLKYIINSLVIPIKTHNILKTKDDLKVIIIVLNVFVFLKTSNHSFLSIEKIMNIPIIINAEKDIPKIISKFEIIFIKFKKFVA